MGGGREANEEAAAVVQADGCGLDGFRNGQILEIFWNWSQEDLLTGCRVRDNPAVGGRECCILCLGVTGDRYGGGQFQACGCTQQEHLTHLRGPGKYRAFLPYQESVLSLARKPCFLL